MKAVYLEVLNPASLIASVKIACATGQQVYIYICPRFLTCGGVFMCIEYIS